MGSVMEGGIFEWREMPIKLQATISSHGHLEVVLRFVNGGF
jgi:hypothetical protein